MQEVIVVYLQELQVAVCLRCFSTRRGDPSTTNAAQTGSHEPSAQEADDVTSFGWHGNEAIRYTGKDSLAWA